MVASFVSLGPACITASILNEAGLRRCSYPLDWARSGGNQINDLLRISANEFYYRHVHTPSLILDQIDVPSPINNMTVELGQKDHIYGFPYFYNPHRTLGEEREYFIRCHNRLTDLVSNRNSRVCFLLSDYANRRGEDYFGDRINEASALIMDALDTERVRCMYSLVICRLYDSHKEGFRNKSVLSNGSYLIELDVTPEDPAKSAARLFSRKFCS